MSEFIIQPGTTHESARIAFVPHLNEIHVTLTPALIQEVAEEYAECKVFGWEASRSDNPGPKLARSIAEIVRRTHGSGQAFPRVKFFIKENPK